MEMLNREELAWILNCHTSTISRWVKQGRIPVLRAGDRGKMRFDLDAVLVAMGRPVPARTMPSDVAVAG
jgi:excisionase family DNA binding protein